MTDVAQSRVEETGS